MKLYVPREVYERRLARMRKLIELKAPPIIIYFEARLILRAYRPTLWHRFTWWLQGTRLGIWWTMLGYREAEFDKTLLSDPHLFNLDKDTLDRILKDVMNTPVESLDAETAALSEMRDEDIDTSDIPEITDWTETEVGKFYYPPMLSCGHPETDWYSVCSAHHGAYQDEDCPACKVGRCITCHPGFRDDNGRINFFNKADGSPSNAFPNLH
jgi:hypothetical protein